MKQLFLVSSFADTYEQLPAFVGSDLTGQRVAFINTASLTEERTSYVDKAFTALESLGLEVTLVNIYADEVTALIESSDMIYVAGGNTFYLLQELQKSGVDHLIKSHIDQGKVYIGESAGSIIMSPNIHYIKEMDDINEGPDLVDYTGFHVISQSPLPHVGNKYLQEAVDVILDKYQDSLDLHPFTDEEVFLIKE